MYINFKYAAEEGLKPVDIVALIYLHQSRVEDLSFYTANINFTSVSEYCDPIKSGPLRLNKKGKRLLEALQIPDVVDNDIKLADYLINRYKAEDRVPCSQSKAAKLIAWFRGETSLTHREMLTLINHFLGSEDGEYSKRLDYLFFKPENAYSKQNLNDSRLYQYFKLHEDSLNFSE